MKKILNSITKSNTNFKLDSKSLSSIKKYLRVDNDSEDEIIETIIDSVISQFEDYTLLALIKKHWQFSYRNFGENRLKLPLKNIVKVSSVKTLSYQNCIHEIDPSQTVLDSDLSIIFFKVIPLTSMLRIELIAGLADNFSNLPSDIKTCLLEHISFLYDNRLSLIHI